jgi:16S rRNA (uracil1498-N3)-methyltransferase
MRSTAGEGVLTAPPVFYSEAAALADDRITLTGAEGRHAATVRWLAVGERADVTDGTGRLAECVVVAARPGSLELSVLRRLAEPAPACPVTVVQAILKGERAELAVELLAEVGVDAIVPWAAERCVARWLPDREARALDRWRSSAREAAKQARRARFPEVTGQARISDVIDLVALAGLAVLLDPAAPADLGSVPLPSAGGIVLVVGPEGGTSQAESDALIRAGAITASLGPSVLRGSTAGAVATAVVLSRSGRWAGPHRTRPGREA